MNDIFKKHYFCFYKGEINQWKLATLTALYVLKYNEPHLKY